MKWLLGAGVAALFALGALAARLGIANRAGGDTAALDRPSESPYKGSEPPARIDLVDFALRDYGGGVVRSSSLHGKVVLLTFLDSQCTESCPVIASQIARAFDLLGAAERQRVFAVAISTDPKEDTAASVRAFLRRNRALGKLHYVGGGEPESKLRPIWKQLPHPLLARVRRGHAPFGAGAHLRRRRLGGDAARGGRPYAGKPCARRPRRPRRSVEPVSIGDLGRERLEQLVGNVRRGAARLGRVDQARDRGGHGLEAAHLPFDPTQPFFRERRPHCPMR